MSPTKFLKNNSARILKTLFFFLIAVVALTGIIAINSALELDVIKEDMSYSYGFGFAEDREGTYISFADSYSAINPRGDGSAKLYLRKNNLLKLIYVEYFDDFPEVDKDQDKINRLIERQVIDLKNEAVIAVANSHNAIIRYGFGGSRKILTRNISGPVNIIFDCDNQAGRGYLVGNRRNYSKSIEDANSPIGVYSIKETKSGSTTTLLKATKQLDGEIRTIGCYKYNGSDYVYKVNYNTGSLGLYKKIADKYVLNNEIYLSVKGHYMTHALINEVPYFIYTKDDGLYAHNFNEPTGLNDKKILGFNGAFAGALVSEISGTEIKNNETVAHEFVISTLNNKGILFVRVENFKPSFVKHYLIDEKLVGNKLFKRNSADYVILNSEYGSQRLSILKL